MKMHESRGDDWLLEAFGSACLLKMLGHVSNANTQTLRRAS